MAEKKNWVDITKECTIRWWHLEGEGSVVEVMHNNGVVALLSPAGGNMTTSPRIRGHYKIEIGESDIPAKWFRILWDNESLPQRQPRPEGHQ